jgi:hypothetical protein
VNGHDPAIRYIVCGSRRWSDRQRIADRLAELPPVATVVVGYDPAKDRPIGADRFVYQEAQKLGLLVETHPADWNGYTHEDFKRFGRKGAGRKRNERMAEFGALGCIAFWDGRSTGTLDMMRRAKAHGISVEVVMKF